MSSGASGPSQQIPALQPDLLGEWFVLRSIRPGLPVAAAPDPAWRCNPNQTAAFLSRLSQDFLDHPVTNDLLSYAPPDAAAVKVLTKMASANTVNLIRAKHPVPRTIMDGVVQAADAGGSRAMNLLGYCFSCGLGVNRDLGQALDW